MASGVDWGDFCSCNMSTISNPNQSAMDHPPQPRDRNVRLLKTQTLGSGSYGVVCKAMYGQRLCAAKLLHHIFFQSNDPGIVTTRRRFEQECRFLNDMKHPNIVAYLGTSHDPDSGLLVLLMELGDESLTHFLHRSQQPLAYHIELDLCHDIAQALAYIHSKEIIHRDLSGNNILLIAGKAKITDFGMSKLLDVNRHMTPLTMCPGTLVYMPPEALRDPPVYTKKLDCFSFGVLQIQIMTRQFPDPGPAMQVVEDSRSPTGTTNMPVLESERRKSHIDLIDPTHALLPIVPSCLSYLENDRPSAQELCQQLATFKETPRYMQLAHLREQNEEQAQQIQQLRQQLQTLQQELQAKEQQLNGQLHANEQATAQFQQNLLQHKQTIKQLQETVGHLRQELYEEKQAGERQLWKLNQQLQTMQVRVQQKETVTRSRQELQQTQQVEHAVDGRERQLQKPMQQLQVMKQKTTQAQKALMQQKTVRDMKWQKQSKAPEKMHRGSAASDSNMAYFNGAGSTKVHSYDFDTQKWRRLPDTPHIQFTLVVVQHILTMVGGHLKGKITNSLLSLMGEFKTRKWLPHFPAMPTARGYTAAVCSGRSLIVAGGEADDENRLNTVEVLDTDTQQWSAACSLPHPFSEATISICGERLYMMGGYDKTGDETRSVITCSLHELLQCRTQPLTGKLRTAPAKQTTKWQQVADAPYYESSCVTLCGQLVAVGGWDRAKKNTTAVFVYNEITDSWEAIGGMPTARCLALVAIVNGKIMVVGGAVGLYGTGTKTDVVEILC